ncbi:cupin domain-containing protein [Listeria grandensis]|uniref:cupin domain-containing protein n=1 Tax=Listeria grandensis TaxID=1494963 RepID=UPI00164EA349|nr:cupin domain-containing protein [Listeria grandensis]MBC6315779.1 cupin domain-containing protein [Listeria grandensis]
MIVKESGSKEQVRENLKDGEGKVKFFNFLHPEDMTNCRLMSKMVLQPKTSIGEHTHIDETEYYYILSGTGMVIDNGEKRRVSTGDLVVTKNGEAHSVVNDGTEPLEIFAMIVTN